MQSIGNERTVGKSDLCNVQYMSKRFGRVLNMSMPDISFSLNMLEVETYLKGKGADLRDTMIDYEGMLAMGHISSVA